MPKNLSPRWNPSIQAPSIGDSEAHIRYLARNTEAPPTAVLVFHGVGKEVRYETLGRAASMILVEAEERGASGISVVVHPVPKDKSLSALVVRAELSWTEKDGKNRQVHVYEVYWAPLTMGKVTYVETVLFLLSAGWNGLTGTFFSRRLTFQRWLFGAFRRLRISWGTPWLILVLMSMIGIVAAIIAMAASAVAGAAKSAGSGGPHPFYDAADYIYKQIAVPFNWVVAHLSSGSQHPLGFVPDLSRQHPWQAAAAFSSWLALIVFGYSVRSLLVQYAGSLVAYLSPYKDSKFDDLRSQIQQVGIDAANVVLNGHSFSKWIPEYERIVYVGHSLGSVIAYDTLNATINTAAARLPMTAPNPAVKRTPALITFGSPLDKTAFLFRVQLKARRNRLDQAGELRETMVSAVQPLITSYKDYRYLSPPRGVKWINLWSAMDIISGKLTYYDNPDDPTVPAIAKIQNLYDPGAWIPLYAHIQYWNKKTLRKTLYSELF